MNKKLITAYVLSSLNVLFIAASVGFSLYTFIFVPIFVVALFFTIRGNLRGWFVWVGCICFLIYFSAQNISSVNPMCRFFFVYNPFVALIIFLSSFVSLLIVLWSSDIRSITSPLIDRIPTRLTAFLLLALLLYSLWMVITDLYGFEFNSRMDLSILFYTSLILTFFITMKIIVILSAFLLFVRRRYIGYFLSYLVLMTISLTWVGNTYTPDPRYLFLGFGKLLSAIIHTHITGHELLLFVYDLFYVSSFVLTILFILKTKEIKRKTGGQTRFLLRRA